MARPKAAAKQQTQPPAPPVFDAAQGESEPQDAIAAINALANSQDGQDWEIQVYQVFGPANQGAKQPWLFNISVDDLRELRNRLAGLFPEGGRFRVICRLNDRIYKSFMLEIARRIGFSSMPAPGDRYTPPQGAVPQSATPDLSELMREMQRQNQEFMRTIISEVRSITAPAPARSLTDSLHEFKAFMELMPQPQAAAPSIGIELFEKGMSFGERLAGMDGGGGQKESMGQMILGIAREVLQPDTVKAIATALAEKPAPAAAPMHQLAANPLDPLAAHQNRNRQQQQHAPAAAEPALSLDQLVEILIQRAAQGQDPAIAADFVLDATPDALLDQLDALPNPVAMLNAKYPMTVQYKDWFSAVLDKMGGDDISEPEGDEPESDAEPEDSN